MAGRSYLYQDPAKIVDFKQRDKFANEEVLDCGGCINKVMWSGEPYCTEGRKILQRCNDYDKGD